MPEAASEAANTVVALMTTWGLKVVGALVVLIVGRFVAGRVRAGIRGGLERRGVEASLVPFLAGLGYYVTLAVVLIAVLGLFGIETTSLVAVLATAGLAVGLALQGTLSNFAAGVMLLLFRPFKLEQYVECAGTAGTVKEIGLFTTVMATPDNVQIIVPNSAVWGEIIKNYSAHDLRRNDLVVGVSYDDDLGKAMATIHEVLAADSRVLKEPEPTVAVGSLGESSVDILVRPWCQSGDLWALRWDLTRRLKEALEAAGCTIPFPQRDVHVYRADGAERPAGASV